MHFDHSFSMSCHYDPVLQLINIDVVSSNHFVRCSVAGTPAIYDCTFSMSTTNLIPNQQFVSHFHLSHLLHLHALCCNSWIKYFPCPILSFHLIVFQYLTSFPVLSKTLLDINQSYCTSCQGDLSSRADLCWRTEMTPMENYLLRIYTWMVI